LSSPLRRLRDRRDAQGRRAVNRLTRDPSYVYNVLKRNPPMASRDLAVSALALRLAPVAAAAELAAGLARRGGTIAVPARRPRRM
jgi:hypothetical protein